MNNAEYFGSGRNGLDGLVKTFRDYLIRRGGEWPNARAAVELVRSALAFARASAMTTLEWKIGDIVQNKDGRYATIVCCHDHALDPSDVWNKEHRYLTVCFADKTDQHYVVSTDDIRKPEFPQGLVELVKSQLRMNCPLKEAECECGK